MHDASSISAQDLPSIFSILSEFAPEDRQPSDIKQ